MQRSFSIAFSKRAWPTVSSLRVLCTSTGVTKKSKAIEKYITRQHLQVSSIPNKCFIGRSYATENSQIKRASMNESLGELIYTGSINRAVYFVKLFSLTSSAVGICLQPWLLSEMAASALVFKVAVVTATGFFVLGTPMLLHFLCKRYVTELYYNEDTNTFTAVRLNFFARPKSFSFKPEDIGNSIPNPFSNFQVGDQAFLLDTDIIRESHPEAYVKFMRYDEPIDLDNYVYPDKEKKGKVDNDVNPDERGKVE